VSAIVREAGVAQGTFYLYFKSKQALLPYLRAEVLGHYLRAFEESTQDRKARADARLVAGVTRIHAIMREQVPIVRVLREATSSEEIEQIWLEGRETLSRPLAELIATGQQDGSFVVDDHRMAAHLALALLDDLLFESIVWQRPAPPAQTLCHATRFLLRALGSTPKRINQLVPLSYAEESAQ
jgi:AcrR family transcriptional regulator